MVKTNPPCILYVGTFPPRECGIATFTQDLVDAIDKEFAPGLKSKILAINDNSTSLYNYPRKVCCQINESEMEHYLRRAKEINAAPEIKLVSIQHEYGIYGGDDGSYLLPFMELLKKPAVVTLHTVLPKPNKNMQSVTRALAERAAKIIVMTHSSAKILAEIYNVPKNKIAVIPHGVHHIPFPSKNSAKQKLNLSGRFILSTFGMLNRDKGIEYALAALPEIIKQYPKVLYLVIGATHPVVRRNEGEQYRNKLTNLVAKLKLKDHVKFYNKYLALPELIDYLKATDIYLSPSLNPLQSVSGTVSYALACACPIIVTANDYAKDVIAPERGRLTRFRNAFDIKRALLEIIGDKNLHDEMKKNAYFFSRQMTWQNVALAYFNIFNEAAKIRPREQGKLPAINFSHLKNLTDDFGIIQFAIHTKPDIYSGYALDDNARALLLGVKYYDANKNKTVLPLVEKYLAFINFVQKPDGGFYDFVSYSKIFTEQTESEDAFGRALWALGITAASKNLPDELKLTAAKLLKKSINRADNLQSLRGMAFALLGLCNFTADETTNNLIKKLADKLVKNFNDTSKDKKDGWFWFEDYLTYSNYKLPEALFCAYNKIRNKKYLAVAEKSILFLNEVSFSKGYLSPVGQNGWYFRGGARAWFDQQPEEAACAVETLAYAYQITKQKKYKEQAQLAFDWFLGKNHLGQMVYDEATGGCYDGLGKFSLNFNQGAESTISYLLARLAIESI
ncbi:MAG: glycosyltransferase [Patescibacteria group bacterium]